MTKEQNTYRYNCATVGESIDYLAQTFSGEADTIGLYILEMAHAKAKEIRTQKQREAELTTILETIANK